MNVDELRGRFATPTTSELIPEKDERVVLFTFWGNDIHIASCSMTECAIAIDDFMLWEEKGRQRVRIGDRRDVTCPSCKKHMTHDPPWDGKVVSVDTFKAWIEDLKRPLKERKYMSKEHKKAPAMVALVEELLKGEAEKCPHGYPVNSDEIAEDHHWDEYGTSVLRCIAEET